MKNLKKVLALAIAFVMCFTMFAGALLFTDVEAGGRYSEAITILSDLGVIAGKPDGSFGINETITRADACCLIARLMTGKQNPPKANHVQVFSDVPSGSYYEDAVSYCVAYGITVGTGGGKFSPKMTITDGQFIAMLTRALGYDTAEHPLEFPMGNISVAQQYGLLENVDVNYQSDALRGEDAQMLYNAMFARYDRAAKNMNVYQAADDHYQTTIAEEVFGMGRLCYDSSTRRATSTNEVDFRGTNIRQPVQCEAHTWVIAGVDARQKEKTYVAFAIDDDTEKAVDAEVLGNEWSYVTFTYENDIKDLLGYRVELWGDMSHDAIDKGYTGNRMDVMAIKTVEGQSAYGYNGASYDGDNNNKLTKVADGTTLIMTRDGNVVNLANIMLQDNNWQTIAPNDRAYKIATVYESNAMCTDTRINLNFQDGDQYKLIDWDSDGDIDFAVRTTYKYAEVQSLSSKRAVLTASDAKIDSNGNRLWGEYALKLDDDNLKVQIDDDVEEGDVVEISLVSRVYDKSDGEVVTIRLSVVDPESQTLEKINLTKDTYTFNGEELSLADRDLFDVVEDDDTYDDLRTRENVGQAFNIWFDRSGYIIKARVADDKARGYLMVLDTYDGTSNLNSNSRRGYAAIDVLFDDNTVGEEVEVVKDLKIDNVSTGGTGYDKSDRTWDQLKVVGNVFKYYMNEDNRITRLESQTLSQSADYSFDDSKDRISILDNNGNINDTNNYVNYSFADDAVIFAARQPDINFGDKNRNYVDRVDKNLGYIRVIPAEYHGEDDTAHRTEIDRYYVDPDDVIAVKVEDIPEIDNRTGRTGSQADVFAQDVAGTAKNEAGTYNWTEDDVTHPYELLPTLKLNGAAYTYRTKAVDLDANASGLLYKNKTSNEIMHFHSVPNGMSGKTTYGYSYTFGDNIGTEWQQASWLDVDGLSAHLIQRDENNNKLLLETPRVAYSLEKKSGNREDIQVAVLGVDTLDYFNQTSVKLALITDVNYYGKDSYSIEAAIDGKVAEFKTIAADESDIFTGRVDADHEISSYSDMQSYLDQDLNPTPFRGRRNGLYAEVTMNSDNLITKVRAMTIIDDNDETVWGNKTNAKIGAFAEGNVYRVVRGVTTQLRSSSKSTLVTFQPNPIAYDGTHLYQLYKSDDWNLYDNLESNFDADTYFYTIDGRPRASRDLPVSIEYGFQDDLTSDLKEATSDALEASEFINTDNDALYFVADFAVRKSDTDQLVAVFVFKDEMKNYSDKAAQGILSASSVRSVFTAVDDGSTPAKPQITEITVKAKDARLGANVKFTYPIDGEILDFFGSIDDDESMIAYSLAKRIEALYGTAKVQTKENVITVQFDTASRDVLVDDYTDNGVTFIAKNVQDYTPKGDPDPDKARLNTITMRVDEFYSYGTGSEKDVDFTITFKGMRINSTDTTDPKITIQIKRDDKVYSREEIIKMILNELKALDTEGNLRYNEEELSYGTLAFDGFTVVGTDDKVVVTSVNN